MLTIRTRLCSGVVLFCLLFAVLMANGQVSATPAVAPDLYLSGAGGLVDVAELNDIEISRNRIAAGPSATQKQLAVRVMGSCADDGGFWFYGRGFAPGGMFLTGANYPDDSAQRGGLYGRLTKEGRANEDGSITALRLDCVDPDTKAHDPFGVYSVVFHELTTGERIRVSFVMR